MRSAVVAHDPDTRAVLQAALSTIGTVVGGDSAGEVDVVVMHAPDGVEPRDLADAAARGALLVLGPDREPDLIAAIEHGALGYLHEDAAVTEVVAAARSVAEGTAVVPPLMLGGLLRHVVERRRRHEAAADLLAALTPREQEVFLLAARGHRRSDIAERLFISSGTVRTHLQRIMQKLGVHSQPELVALAAETDLVGDGEEEPE